MYILETGDRTRSRIDSLLMTQVSSSRPRGITLKRLLLFLRWQGRHWDWTSNTAASKFFWFQAGHCHRSLLIWIGIGKIIWIVPNSWACTSELSLELMTQALTTMLEAWLTTARKGYYSLANMVAIINQLINSALWYMLNLWKGRLTCWLLSTNAFVISFGVSRKAIRNQGLIGRQLSKPWPMGALDSFLFWNIPLLWLQSSCFGSFRMATIHCSTF